MSKNSDLFELTIKKTKNGNPDRKSARTIAAAAGP
jgi:hypothetical protein